MRARSASSAAAVFKALGDTRRLRIVERLNSGTPLSITAVSAGTDISRQAVTKHLHVLAKAGVVKPVRAGREQQYEIQPAAIANARTYLEAIGREWERSLERLRELVE